MVWGTISLSLPGKAFANRKIVLVEYMINTHFLILHLNRKKR